MFPWCVCVVFAQLTIEKDKLKEAQRLVRESEAKVGVLFARVAIHIDLASTFKSDSNFYLSAC